MRGHGRPPPPRLVFGNPPRLSVQRQDLLQGVGLAGSAVRKRRLDDPGNVGERNGFIEKGLHRHFVRGVENGALAAARAGRLESEPETGKAPEIGRHELERADPEEIQALDAGFEALRPAEGMCDGSAHVGVAELRQH